MDEKVYEGFYVFEAGQCCILDISLPRSLEAKTAGNWPVPFLDCQYWRQVTLPQEASPRAETQAFSCGLFMQSFVCYLQRVWQA